MKITPLDIRQKSFNKKFWNGLDPEEVSAFMNSLSQAWERVLEENRELRFRLESAERDASQFREVQNGLYKAIQAADDKYAELIENGNQQANFVIREAKANADSTIKDAEWRSKTLIEEAEQQARNTWLELRNHVNGLKTEYTQLEGMRQLLLSEIKNFSNELLERVDRVAINHKTVSFELPPMPSHLLANPADKKQDDQPATDITTDGTRKATQRLAQPDPAQQPSQGRPFIRTSAQQTKQTNRSNSTPPSDLQQGGTTNNGTSPTATNNQSVRPEAIQQRTRTASSAQPNGSGTTKIEDGLPNQPKQANQPIQPNQPHQPTQTSQTVTRPETKLAMSQQQIDRPDQVVPKSTVEYQTQRQVNTESIGAPKGGSFFDNI